MSDEGRESWRMRARDSRPHQSLDGNAPRPPEIEPSSQGRIVAEPQVRGLHHRYRRAA
jgi:hypothetical protein